MKALAEEEGQPFNEEASREKFGQLEANGQIWIDAENFALHRLQWHVPTLTLEGGSEASLSFQVDLRDHNSALTIAPPKDAVPFSPQNLLSGTLPAEADTILEEQNSSQESLGDILRSIRN